MGVPNFKIEPPKSLATQVAQRLREAIIDGQFALGEMIPEETLALSFGVSRTPARGAQLAVVPGPGDGEAPARQLCVRGQ